jgi:hypothetical protein
MKTSYNSWYLLNHIRENLLPPLIEELAIYKDSEQRNFEVWKESFDKYRAKPWYIKLFFEAPIEQQKPWQLLILEARKERLDTYLNTLNDPKVISPVVLDEDDRCFLEL